MNSKLLVGPLVALVALSSTVSRVSAETPVQVRMENRVEWQEKRDENQEMRQEKRQERRESLTEVHANRLEKRFSGYETRLQNIIARIEKRLTALKNEGKNVSELESKLANAKLALTTAVSQGDEAIAKFRAINPNLPEVSHQRAQALMARDSAQAARESFETVLKTLKEIVKSIKTLE